MSDLLVLKLTPEEMDLVGNALGMLPFNRVVALMNNLQRQLGEQHGTSNAGRPAGYGGNGASPIESRRDDEVAGGGS